MKDPLFKWSGEYAGFIYGGRLFDASSDYIGWIEDDGRCWDSGGAFLGELVEGSYVLRRSAMATPASRAARAHPATPAMPARRADRAGRATRAGWDDALEDL